MKNEAPEQQLEQLRAISTDIKAEVIIANLYDLDMVGEQVIVNRKGQFKRAHRRDVLGTGLIDFKLDDNQFIQIDLSRDGIYDMLPEAFFHAAREDKGSSVEKMTATFKRKKKEEKEARLFFQPFENELFFSTLGIELTEKELLYEINSGKSLDFMYEFWQIDQDLLQDLKINDPQLIPKFINMLPFVHQIVGDFDLTKECLSFLLDEDVKCKIINKSENNESNLFSLLGDCRLGLDAIAGQSYEDHSIEVEFEIGPLKKSTFYDYIHNGDKKRFIHLFFNYFIPVEIDASFSYIMPVATETFKLTEDSFLSITTKI